GRSESASGDREEKRYPRPVMVATVPGTAASLAARGARIAGLVSKAWTLSGRCARKSSYSCRRDRRSLHGLTHRFNENRQYGIPVPAKAVSLSDPTAPASKPRSRSAFSNGSRNRTSVEPTSQSFTMLTGAFGGARVLRPPACWRRYPSMQRAAPEIAGTGDAEGGAVRSRNIASRPTCDPARPRCPRRHWGRTLSPDHSRSI